MELYPLQVFLMIASEKSFSRAAEKLLRTQPAVSLALQRLELELGEKLIDRSAKELVFTDAGQTVLDYARRFENLRQEMENALAELRDNSAGRLTIGANESTTLYLLGHIERYRKLYPKQDTLCQGPKRWTAAIGFRSPHPACSGRADVLVLSRWHSPVPDVSHR